MRCYKDGKIAVAAAAKYKGVRVARHINKFRKKKSPSLENKVEVFFI